MQTKKEGVGGGLQKKEKSLFLVFGCGVPPSSSSSYCHIAHGSQHHDRLSGTHLTQRWRLQISCESMACVIAQRRVQQPIVDNGNPLIEHNQLFVRAYVCADQQVLSLKHEKWMEVEAVAAAAAPI